MNRRDVLALAGSSLVAVLAGCSGGNDEENLSPQKTPPSISGDGGQSGSTPADRPDTDTDTGGTPASDTDGNSGGGNENLPGKPAAVLRKYVSAVNSGDKQTAVSLLHKNGKVNKELVSQDITYFKNKDVTVTKLALADKTENAVVVRSTLEVVSGNDETQRIALQMRFRQNQHGEWRVFASKAYRVKKSGSGSDSGGNQTTANSSS